MQNGFCFSSKFVGSRIIWLSSSADDRFSIAIPSLLVLKSPVKNTVKGFKASILAYKFLKFDKKA